MIVIKFSIVIPVYNVEIYLPICIESVLTQDYPNFEVILVNDGSTDNSSIICDEYVKSDSRVKVVHQQNKGVAEARNHGISLALGEYIFFLDSDDILDECVLSRMNSLILNHNNMVDLVTFAHYNLFNDNNFEYKPVENSILLNTKDYISKVIKSNQGYWAPWKNLYKTKIIKDNNISFPKEISCAEDFHFFIKYVMSSNNFMFVNEPTIYYRCEREGSITSTLNKRCVLDQLKVFSDLHKNLNKKSKNDTVNLLSNFYAQKFANTLYSLHKISENEDITDIQELIIKEKSILKNVVGIKYRIAVVIWNIFGFHKGSKVLKKYFRSI